MLKRIIRLIEAGRLDVLSDHRFACDGASNHPLAFGAKSTSAVLTVPAVRPGAV